MGKAPSDSLDTGGQSNQIEAGLALKLGLLSTFQVRRSRRTTRSACFVSPNPARGSEKHTGWVPMKRLPDVAVAGTVVREILGGDRPREGPESFRLIGK